MASLHSTRQRLIQAALDLFARQGVTETTTRQIAELAAVNEVTLFRQFGNKHGLLLAVIEEAAAFTHWSQSVVQQSNQTSSINQTLRDYAIICLEALEQAPEFLRSVVGESGQYPLENRQALGRDLTQANHYIAQYLAAAIERGQLQTHLPVEKVVGLLNGMLLGYTVIQFTSEFHELWDNREDFLDNLVELFLHGAVSQPEDCSKLRPDQADLQTWQPGLVSSAVLEQTQRISTATETLVADLPAHLVHSILQRAKKLGFQDYALAYVLFAAGLDPLEIATMGRSQQICDVHQHLLQVTQVSRQVPVNQWIMGKRYGTYTRNPLTRWLKSRKDPQPAMFLNDAGSSLSAVEVELRWQVWIEGLLTPEGQPPAIEQAQQTWCVEMLVKGISLPSLSILTGWNLTKLQPYAWRAREKVALEQVIRLDQSPSNGLKSDR